MLRNRGLPCLRGSKDYSLPRCFLKAKYHAGYVGDNAWIEQFRFWSGNTGNTVTLRAFFCSHRPAILKRLYRIGRMACTIPKND
jgi:hypothetical protein